MVWGGSLHLVVALLWIAGTQGRLQPLPPASTVEKVDIVVAGGSTAALAAAITAATSAPDKLVLLTDPTDWLGGQLTASGVSAIDFGQLNRMPANQDSRFRSLMQAMGAPANPGGCWVSTMCYEPKNLVEAWIAPTIAKLPNLRVSLNTVITGIEPCDRDTRAPPPDQDSQICALNAVRRRPRLTSKSLDSRMPSLGAADGWSQLLSEAVGDWYSPAPSITFAKEVLRLEAAVFIEATEWGDVLLTGAAHPELRLPVAQGVETPTEGSIATDDTCGQAATLTFFMEIAPPPPVPGPPVPPGSTAGPIPFDIPNDGAGHALPRQWTWDDVWRYRRSTLGGPGGAGTPPAVGDATQQNWGGGNDLDNAYLFRPLGDAVAAAAAGHHEGGLNLTALGMLEQRAFGWYHFYHGHWNASASSASGALVLARARVGTATGLSKMPYLRDTRRSGHGIGQFRLAFADMMNAADPGSKFGLRFNDTVALGNYPHDVHGLRTCQLPGYVTAASGAKPYYIPFRALTNGGASNLLVAGKAMAQSFSANAATRLHPSEWTSGVAAGAAAALMATNTSLRSTSRIYEAGLPALQKLLRSETIDQPLEWTPQ